MIIFAQLWNKLCRMHNAALPGTCRREESGSDTTLPDDDVYNLGTRRGRVQVDGALSQRSLLPENGIDATPFLSEVYKKGTRARKRLADVSLYGRSMVEMLGVLAIIGVLSVGAISGYQKAMFKYKLNKQTEQISTLLSAVSRYQKDLKLNDGSTTSYSLIPLLKKINEIPVEMFMSNNSSAVQDALNNMYTIYSHSSGYIGILTHINSSNTSIDSCKNIFMTAKGYYQNISALQIGKTVDGSFGYTSNVMGEKLCTSEKKCLKDLNILDTDELCRVCDMGQTCTLYIIWW